MNTQYANDDYDDDAEDDSADDWEAPDESDIDQSNDAEEVDCPYCGKLIYEGAEFCPHCHHNAPVGGRVNQRPPWQAGIIVLLILTFAGVIGILLQFL